VRRISKKVREEAALICAISASEPGTRRCYDFEIAKDLGLWRGSIAKTAKRPSVALALAAWTHVFNADEIEWSEETDAEAEALLRCDWSPGDEP
jgi:hypothetical protein